MRGVGPWRNDNGTYRSMGAPLLDGHTDNFSYFNADPLVYKKNNIIGIIQRIALQLYGEDGWFSQSYVLDLAGIINRSDACELEQLLQDIAENRSFVQPVRVLQNNIANITISFKDGMLGPIGVNHAHIIMNYLISGQYYELADFLLSDVFSEPVLNTPSYIGSNISSQPEVVVLTRTIKSRDVQTNNETGLPLNTKAQNQSNITPISPGTEQNITRSLELSVERTDEPSRVPTGEQQPIKPEEDQSIKPTEEQKQSEPNSEKGKTTYKQILTSWISGENGGGSKIPENTSQRSEIKKSTAGKRVETRIIKGRNYEQILQMVDKEKKGRDGINDTFITQFSKIKETFAAEKTSIDQRIARRTVTERNAQLYNQDKQKRLEHKKYASELVTKEEEDRKIIHDEEKNL